MSAPSQKIRLATYDRDGHRCASCGAVAPLQYQHRAASGHGGNPIRPKVEEGLTSCATCNPAYEAQMQAEALACGWKIPRWVQRQGLAARVPVFVKWAGQWVALTEDGQRESITAVEALARMVNVYGAEQYAEMRVAA